MDFYSTCARILDTVACSAPSSAISLRTLCLNAVSKSSSAKASASRCYALVAETLKYLPTLNKLVASTDILKQEAKVLGKKQSPSPKNLVVVLAHDLLFAKKGIALPKEHKLRQAVERYAVRFRANLQREKIRAGVSVDEGLQVSIDKYTTERGEGKGKRKASEQDEDLEEEDPDSLEGKIRWLRVNENKWTVDEAVSYLTANAYRESPSLKSLVTKGGRVFCLDEHIPNLIAFPISSLNLPKFEPYRDSRFIAQDKASCMPAFLLLQGNTGASSSSQDEIVIDATSAPGNKTSYAAATLQRLGRGQVYAFERDSKRYSLLKQMLAKAGCKNVTTVLADFLEKASTEEPYNNATHILVDPSCSGSGIHSDPVSSAEELQARLKPLSGFQRHILAHALRFPNARKVVYSTCSVHSEENENVVFDVLDKPEFRDWKVQRRQQTIPDWPIRGIDADGQWEGREENLEGMIRCERRMGTHGFFVAVLVRDAINGLKEDATEQDSAEPDGMEDDTSSGGGSEVGKINGEDLSFQISDSDEASVAAWIQARPQFSLLRLATVDRHRRRAQEVLQAAEYYRKRAKVA